MKTGVTVLLLLFITLFLSSWKLSENGFALGGACDIGFGKRLHEVQEAAIRRYFIESLPKIIDVENMTCSGFPGRTLVATFHISNGEARQLVSELEATFMSRQNDSVVADSQKRRRMIGLPTYIAYIYDLPGAPAFDSRTVTVSFPKDTSRASTVVFEGGNY
jgi:hypothetical protein